MTQQFAAEWKRKAMEAHVERSQLIARGDAEAVRQYERSARTRLGDLKLAGQDAVAKEVRRLVAQKAKDWQIDVVFDTSSLFVLHEAGWTNITTAIQLEISP